MSNKKMYMNYNNTNRSAADVTEVYNKEVKEVNDTLVDEVTEDLPAEEPVEEPMEEPVEAIPEKKESLVGYVSGCTRLNIRKSPSTTGEVTTIVSEKAMLLVDPNESTDEWYRVCTESGVDGYCMKKYVTVSN